MLLCCCVVVGCHYPLHTHATMNYLPSAPLTQARSLHDADYRLLFEPETLDFFGWEQASDNWEAMSKILMDYHNMSASLHSRRFYYNTFKVPYRKFDHELAGNRAYAWDMYCVFGKRHTIRERRRFQIWEAVQLTKAQAVVRGMLTRRVVHSAMCSPDADALPRAIDYCQRADIECPPFPKIV